MGLIKRGAKYSVRYTVPTSMRETVGTAQVWRTTGTGCISEAKRREPRILADIIDEVEAKHLQALEASDSPRSPAYLLTAAEELLKNVESGKWTEEEASDVMHDIREQFLKLNQQSNAERAMQAARSATALLTSGGTTLPLSMAKDKHLDHLRSRGRNLSTVERKGTVIQRFIDFSGDPSVRDVDRQIVGRWIELDLNASDLTSKTKVWYISALQAAWTYFILHGMADLNPFEKMSSLVQQSKKGVTESEPTRAWTRDELDILKTLDKDDPMYGVSVIRLHSGIRLEEACALRVEDIDADEWVMHIRAGKNQQSVRTIPIHSALQGLFESLIESSKDGWLFDLKPGGRDKKRSHNFSKRAGRWSRKYVTEDKGVTQYTLRHTYAQALRDAGVDRETIEFTTGHKDQSMLFGTYATQVGLDRLREAIEKLDFGF